jgi:hypothetical protein
MPDSRREFLAKSSFALMAAAAHTGVAQTPGNAAGLSGTKSGAQRAFF